MHVVNVSYEDIRNPVAEYSRLRLRLFGLELRPNAFIKTKDRVEVLLAVRFKIALVSVAIFLALMLR